MSTTTKTVLIVGAAAVAAFVLLRALAPQPVARPTGPTIGGVSVNGILDFGAQAFGAVRGLFSEPAKAPTEIDGVSTADFQAGHFGTDYS